MVMRVGLAVADHVEEWKRFGLAGADPPASAIHLIPILPEPVVEAVGAVWVVDIPPEWAAASGAAVGVVRVVRVLLLGAVALRSGMVSPLVAGELIRRHDRGRRRWWDGLDADVSFRA